MGGAVKKIIDPGAEARKKAREAEQRQREELRKLEERQAADKKRMEEERQISEATEGRNNARSRQRARASQAQGRRSTILTTGEEEAGATATKTLLGQG